MKKPIREGDWPYVSPPARPPKVNWLYSRVIGDTPQGVNADNFAELWQAGVYLRTLLKECDQIDVTDDERGGSELRYSVVTERAADGSPLSGRRFFGRLVGATFEQVMKASEGKVDVELPFVAYNSVRNATGKPAVRFHEWRGEEGTSGDEVPAEDAAQKRPASGKPRKGGAGLVTLAELCLEARVNPSDVRGVLRKRKIEKPAGGWVYETSDPRIDVVREVIRVVKAGGKK